MYLDSLDGKKEPALDLLRAYLHEEHHARRRKREAAAAQAAAPAAAPAAAAPVKLEVKPEAKQALEPVVPGKKAKLPAKIVPFGTPAPDAAVPPEPGAS